MRLAVFIVLVEQKAYFFRVSFLLFAQLHTSLSDTPTS